MISKFGARIKISCSLSLSENAYRKNLTNSSCDCFMWLNNTLTTGREAPVRYVILQIGGCRVLGIDI